MATSLDGVRKDVLHVHVVCFKLVHGGWVMAENFAIWGIDDSYHQIIGGEDIEDHLMVHKKWIHRPLC